MIYCAIDPGGTTGWAVWDSEHDGFVSGETKGRFEFRAQFDNFTDSYTNTEITFIIENFTISARTLKTALDYSALRIIGYVELECEARDYTLDWQMPGQIKSTTTVGTDINLKKIDWYLAGHGGHANDAARHLLVFVRNLAAAQHLMKRIAA